MTDLEINNLKTQISLLQDITSAQSYIFYGFQKQVKEIIKVLKNRTYSEKEKVQIIEDKDYFIIVEMIRNLEGLQNLKNDPQIGRLKDYGNEIEMKKGILEKLMID